MEHSKSEKIKVKVQGQDLEAFGVYPISNCPHITEQQYQTMDSELSLKKEDFPKQQCQECSHEPENWFCLSCRVYLCSRYQNAHMAEHFSEERHPISFSLFDGSFYCYECDYYITNQKLDQLRKTFSRYKFSNQGEQELIDQFKDLSVLEKNKEQEVKQNYLEENQEEQKQEESQDEKEKGFKLEDLVVGLKEGRFKKVAFLTGAGLSVSAGIPDFRTPGTGLYDQIKKYNLPYPECVFMLDYFRENPEPFYKVAAEFLEKAVKPSINHYFISLFSEKDILLVDFTQNIDGLEIEAGLPVDKVIQAHGHMRSAHCISCKKEGEISQFKEYLKRDKILYCESCKEGLVKPDIVFFGEQLPSEFFKRVNQLEDCDLAFVMGTSLNVIPFSQLVHLIPEDVPIVLINRENSMDDGMREKFLFLSGDMDENVQKIIEACGWSKDLENLKSKLVS